MIWIFTITLYMVAFLQNASAQTPQNYPSPDPKPVPFTPFNIIFYILIPILIIIVFLWIRRSSKKNKQ